MTWTSTVRPRPGMPTPHARRGAMIVLVIFVIFLAGILATLASARTVQLVRVTRQQRESIVLRQMADSALAWLKSRPNWREAVPAVLDATRLVPDGTSGTVRISVSDAEPDVVVIEARLTSGQKKRRLTTSFKLP